VQSTAKEAFVRGAGLMAMLLILMGVFALVLRKDVSARKSTNPQATGVGRTASEEFAFGTEALKNEDVDEALARFSDAIRLDPENALAYYYRGGILFGRNEFDRAFADFSKSIRLDPHSGRAFFARATIYTRRKDFDLAIADLSEAIRLEPENSFYLNNRAFVHRQQHEYELAIADYEDAIRLMPEHDAPAGGLAWILATCPDAGMRDGARAVKLATRACEITHWKDRIALETLAAACAECQDFPAAVQLQQQALALRGDPNRIAEGRLRLKLFEDEQPFRDE
jgi:tetratricopeptide (TPR) repeat protein